VGLEAIVIVAALLLSALSAALLLPLRRYQGASAR